METLLNLLLIGGFLFVMMKFGCGRHMFGHGAHGKADESGHGGADTGRTDRSAGAPALVWEAPSEDVDPVCGKTVATQSAKSSVFAGEVHYFCSRECREAFEAAPHTYLPARAAAATGVLEHENG